MQIRVRISELNSPRAQAGGCGALFDIRDRTLGPQNQASVHSVCRALTAFILALAMSACSASAPTGRTSPVTQAPSGPAQQFKPGSHSAAVFERLQQLRIAHPERFKRLLAAYGASHGDMSHPAMVAIRNDLMNWLAVSESDYAQLPVYMKTFAGSGPYRRLITKPGYSYVSGKVFLPCKAAHLHPHFETAFAYVGGWGVGSAGEAVDAGFQRSNLYDDYAAFIRAQGLPQVSKEPRFKCGRAVEFAFSAVSNTELRLWTKGLTENNKVEVVVAKLRHDALYGWPAAGGGSANGIVLKRMTTIGQNDPEKMLPPGRTWDNDGSYFGRLASGKQPIVHWLNLKVGRVDERGNPVGVVAWGTAQTDESLNAGTRNYPDNPFNIWFTCTGCPNESDAINLVDVPGQP